ncbi:MAG: citramalate synthase [Armatimonadota bacterium]
MPNVAIYDTTLRDGTQGEGINFSAEDKIKVAKKLDEFGISYIEGGWPGSNPKDVEFFARAKDIQFQNAKLAAFSSTRRAKLTADSDPNIAKLIEADTPVVTIFGKSWTLHVDEVLRVSRDENLEIIRDTVKFLVDNGREVFFDAEHFFDGYKDDSEYALETLIVAAEAGANAVVLCETNGGALPWEVAEIVEKVIQKCKVKVGIHAHNDSELAVANSVIAVRHGASHVQGTMNGVGERCGNANLCSIIPIIELKMGKTCLPAGKIKELTSTAHSIDEIANRVPIDSQPFVGASAFAHKAGVHVNAVQKNSRTYEHMDPELVGNRRRVLISELSGRSVILEKAEKYDIDLSSDNEKVKSVLSKVMSMEHNGYTFEDAEASFELLLKKEMGQYDKLFDLIGFRIIVEKRGPNEEPITEATLKIAVDGKQAFTVAEGDGPVHALDSALRLALNQFFGEELTKIKLTDYKVRVVNTRAGTAAKVRTIIESRDKDNAWSTVGVSTNIIEASWEALADSVEYGIQKQLDKK